MLLTDRKPKFVLIDPSFEGAGGDKWQYAMTFFDSTMRNGFDFVLLANKKSPLIQFEAKAKVDQRNVFDIAFYQHGNVVSRSGKGEKRLALKRADATVNKELSELAAKVEELRRAGEFVAAQRLADKRAARLESYVKESAAAMEAIERDEPPPKPFNRDDFARTLAEQIKDLQLRKGDALFLHTATQGMMESLTEVTAHLGTTETLDVDAYFLFHFGAEAPDARTFIDRYYSCSNFETLSLRLKTGSPFRRNYLLATCEQLRDELESFFSVPVGLFHGLTNLDRYIESLGGAQSHEAMRAAAAKALETRVLSLGVRVADLDEACVASLQDVFCLLRQQGYKSQIRCAYHAGNKGKAVKLLGAAEGQAFKLVDTNEQKDYIRFLAESTIVLLPYRPDVYKKRVSAVLHDCAVLGVPCVVPRGSTLEHARAWADIYCYDDIKEIPGVVFRAAAALRAEPARAAARVGVAAALFASDVVSRLTGAMQAPSLTVERRGPVATVIMPLWGRVGSSCVFEAQMRFLLEQGYFVLQILALDKPAQPMEAIPYFWGMLDESSKKMRGSLQRVAFRTKDMDSLPADSDGFDVYLDNIGLNSLWDDVAERVAKESALTLVNHVFNARLARRIGAGKFILETHDIQSAQMAHWPLRNPFTNQPESFDALLCSEFLEIEKFDFLVNISAEEHKQFVLVNPKAKVVTPYIPPNAKPPRYESVSTMAHALGWDPSYHNIFKFDYLLIGDSHPANVESARWFVKEVFIPHLQPLHHSLAIVGRLSGELFKNLEGLGNVYYCGFVEDIAEVRALSRIAILADRRGSGISIKTLETLAFGGAFVGTSIAFRGLAHQLSSPPPTHDDPQAFALRLRELIEDESKQAALGKEAWEMYRQLAGKTVFEAAWRDILESLGLPTAPGERNLFASLMGGADLDLSLYPQAGEG